MREYLTDEVSMRKTGRSCFALIRLQIRPGMDEFESTFPQGKAAIWLPNKNKSVAKLKNLSLEFVGAAIMPPAGVH